MKPSSSMIGIVEIQGKVVMVVRKVRTPAGGVSQERRLTMNTGWDRVVYPVPSRFYYEIVYTTYG
jgi:hypothetical protein